MIEKFPKSPTGNKSNEEPLRPPFASPERPDLYTNADLEDKIKNTPYVSAEGSGSFKESTSPLVGEIPRRPSLSSLNEKIESATKTIEDDSLSPEIRAAAEESRRESLRDRHLTEFDNKKTSLRNLSKKYEELWPTEGRHLMDEKVKTEKRVEIQGEIENIAAFSRGVDKDGNKYSDLEKATLIERQNEESKDFEMPVSQNKLNLVEAYKELDIARGDKEANTKSFNKKSALEKLFTSPPHIFKSLYNEGVIFNESVKAKESYFLDKIEYSGHSPLVKDVSSLGVKIGAGTLRALPLAGLGLLFGVSWIANFFMNKLQEGVKKGTGIDILKRAKPKKEKKKK